MYRPPDRMLAAPRRRLFLAAFWAIHGCCCLAWQYRHIVAYRRCPAWQLVVHCICMYVDVMVCVCQTLIKKLLYFTFTFILGSLESA